jgi:hypothetical protein
MLRAAAWTFGLFGAGMLICRLFPMTWIEPAVLFGLGIAFLAVSARSGVRPRRARTVAGAKEAAA